MRRRGAIALLAATVASLTTIRYRDALGDVAPASPALDRAYRRFAELGREISVVRAIHLPDGVLTRASISLEELERYEPDLQRASVTDRATIARIEAFFDRKRTRVDPDARRYDARWRLTFSAPSHAPIVLGFDAFGRRGSIDGVPVRFIGAPFVDRLAQLLPHVVK